MMYQVILVGDTETPFTSSSKVLRPDAYHDGSTPHRVSVKTLETYGDTTSPTTIRISNGGLGPTGILKVLTEEYIKQTGTSIKVEWIGNHSRHSQIALQSGKVDIALTYEREEEATAEEEGWSRTVGVLCHDHFLLVGPREDGLKFSSIGNALKTVAERKSLYHTRGDGSATMHVENALWDAAGIPLEQRMEEGWYKRIPCTPREALRNADVEGAYLLTDRATYLPALHHGELSNTVVYVEGGQEMMNTCVMCIRAEEHRREVLDFVEWLRAGSAQKIFASYGREWQLGIPVVTPKSQLEFDKSNLLQAVDLSVLLRPTLN